jgi:hypothetical protein
VNTTMPRSDPESSTARIVFAIFAPAFNFSCSRPDARPLSQNSSISPLSICRWRTL